MPVTRIDFSGYGESLFSNWRNPTDDPVAVSQARFDVLVGRTAYEVVQVRSILYPYAVRVVRTITIDSLNIASTDFNLIPAQKEALYQSGVNAAKTFLDHWDFQKYIAQYRSGQPLPTRREQVLS